MAKHMVGEYNCRSARGGIGTPRERRPRMATEPGDGTLEPAATADAQVKEDERKLAELGYKQELSRAWSGFTNFAISFTIISVLAGTFTTFAFGWQNGGPIAISIGWPVL